MNDAIVELMEEPSGGHNHGRRAQENPPAQEGTQGRRQPLDSETWRTAEFLREGGWIPLDVNQGGRRGGMSAHRGVISSDEYVDAELLRELASAELGFTYEQIRSVYRRGGPRGPEQRELRGLIDASVLAVSRSGGNLAQLAEALGLDDNVIKSAVTRAKEAELL